MKNENKCFFSISLKNGITITGKNPEHVLDYLYDLHSCFFESAQDYKRLKCSTLANHAYYNMNCVEHAINTIKENWKGGEK